MEESTIKNVLEAALLAAGRPLTLDKLMELFSGKGEGPDRAAVKAALGALADDYADRGIELKEVASGFRVQVRSTMQDWLMPLWEERAPRYTRALLETLALIAYRQPITRGEIEEIRGVAVSTNIVRTLMERAWIRVVGHRDVPGKPAMLGTTREFLDYFGLKKLEDLPPLSEIKDGLPEMSPQADFIEAWVPTAASAATESADDEAAGTDGGEAPGAERSGTAAADEGIVPDSAGSGNAADEGGAAGSKHSGTLSGEQSEAPESEHGGIADGLERQAADPQRSRTDDGEEDTDETSVPPSDAATAAAIESEPR